MKDRKYKNNYNHQTKIRYKTSIKDAEELLQNINDKQLQKFLAWTRMYQDGITRYEEYLFQYKGDIVLPLPPTTQLSRNEALEELIDWLDKKGKKLDNDCIKKISSFDAKFLEQNLANNNN